MMSASSRRCCTACSSLSCSRMKSEEPEPASETCMTGLPTGTGCLPRAFEPCVQRKKMTCQRVKRRKCSQGASAAAGVRGGIPDGKKLHAASPAPGFPPPRRALLPRLWQGSASGRCTPAVPSASRSFARQHPPSRAERQVAASGRRACGADSAARNCRNARCWRVAAHPQAQQQQESAARCCCCRSDALGTPAVAARPARPVRLACSCSSSGICGNCGCVSQAAPASTHSSAKPLPGQTARTHQALPAAANSEHSEQAPVRSGRRCSSCRCGQRRSAAARVPYLQARRGAAAPPARQWGRQTPQRRRRLCACRAGRFG